LVSIQKSFYKLTAIPQAWHRTIFKPTGEHFTQPGHKTSDMTCTVIEQVLPANDPFLRKRREKWWINKYQAVEYGANTQE
jgi:hypothetical protein